MSMPMSSADTGSSATGTRLSPHVTGNPISDGGIASGEPTVFYTALIPILALAGLWFLGGILFRTVRS